jgi:ADP-heptose:LPS heptosyltransferase
MMWLKGVDRWLIGPLTALLPPCRKREIIGNIKRILVIRPGGIGDAVFLLPILKSLKADGVTIDVLCERRNKEVFTSQPDAVDKLYCYPRDLSAVFANTYDAVIDTEQWHYMSAWVAYFLRARCKIGFATQARRKRLFTHTVNYGINEYELDNFVRLFAAVFALPQGIEVEGSFAVEPALQEWAAHQISSQSVTVFLGASILLRRLRPEQIKKIIDHYTSENRPMVLLGGRDVEAAAEKVMMEAKARNVINYVGELSLAQSAALIQRSSLFVGPDSGLMHVASAVGAAVITIFGPGNLSKWGPKSKKARVISEHVSCSPCTHFGYTRPTCNGSYHCMSGIKIEEAWKS